MTRISSVVFVIAAGALVSLGTGCNKPSEESCRKALGNMRLLLGTENLNSNADLDGDVRRCRGGSSKKAVDCATKATTLEQLRACDFMKLADKKPAPGSATDVGSAGSATPAMGSGSAAPAGSGSAADGAAGSAGSAGSAAAPTAGSAGSAMPPAGSGSAY
ncbi:MAG: hypothetical protein H0T89_24900 [Deltaproteobacteria bacterium]|nr:hypothetical protein [Deltaproteobacteria bacterium]MDQ3299488.1 hypothetical protein [Myxococcota bacterium]